MNGIWTRFFDKDHCATPFAIEIIKVYNATKTTFREYKVGYVFGVRIFAVAQQVAK